jgi:hypothetical protein
LGCCGKAAALLLPFVLGAIASSDPVQYDCSRAGSTHA